MIINKIRNMFSGDRGDSLVEVVIATVIMSMLGLTIVGSILSSRPLSDKLNTNGLVMASLNSAASQIQIQNFAACSPNNSNWQPYSLSSAVAQSNAATKSGVSITTTQLPVAEAPINGKSFAYSTTLSATGGSTYTWSVWPKLPTGLTLNSATGVISGTPVEESSDLFKFTATSGASSDTKSLLLAVVTINVQVPSAISSSSVTWSDCQSVPKYTVTGATATSGNQITYTYSGGSNIFAAGDLVSISGITSNPSSVSLNATSATVLSNPAPTANSFTVSGTAIATYVSGGEVGFVKNVNIQRIVITTTQGSQQFSRVLAKAV